MTLAVLLYGRLRNVALGWIFAGSTIGPRSHSATRNLISGRTTECTRASRNDSHKLSRQLLIV